MHTDKTMHIERTCRPPAKPREGCRQPGRKILRGTILVKNEKGFTLVETLIAMLVLAVIAVAFLAALNAAGKALYITNERQKAISLAESQMEYVKQQGYFFSYSPVPISNEYAGYSVTIDTSNITSRDWNIQGISVIVSHQGKPIIITGGATLQDYKVN